MDGYGPDSYGEGMADVYDDWFGVVSDWRGAVMRLREWAHGGPVLELGVGTGRVAIPLAEAGVEVWGLDASPAMLERLRARPGGAAVRTVVGDMAELDVDAPSAFGLVCAVYNSFFNLTTEAAQRRCLERVHQVLAPGGHLVLEVAVLSSEGPDEEVSVRTIEKDQVVLSVSRRHRATQTVAGQYVDISEGGIRLRPWQIRYLSPPQLDTLAADAGFELVGRWRGWREQEFDDRSDRHVSLYRPI